MRPPIALFAYKRPDHLRRTLESLIRCNGFAESALTVYCDGPKSPADAEAVALARGVAQEVLGSNADLRFAAENKGLARSVIAGVTELVEAHGSVIVVEDDFELSATFLDYMNDALARFADDGRVYQVSGHMFDVPEFANRNDAILLPFTTTWGWGTWSRAWSAFDPSASGWQELATDRRMRRRFNLGGVYDYSSMLKRQMEGRRDSWGVLWYWSVFRARGLSVFPPTTLVQNTGQDGSGTHGSGSLRRFSDDGSRTVPPVRIVMPTDPVAVNDADVAAVLSAIWRQNGGWLGSAVDLAKRFLR